MKISIIIPVLNDAAALLPQLQSLQAVRRQGHEVVVVDGGSSDDPAAVQQGLCDRFAISRPGRARQMNRGAELASGDLLLFLHADTYLPDQASARLTDVISGSVPVWGRFDLRLSSGRPVFRVIETAINLRSHVTGVATGDQAMFVRTEVFRQIGGFPDLPLMEDVALSKHLRALGWPVRIRDAVTTSSRRWEQRGIVTTVLLMWWLRLLYFLGVRPDYLVRKYYPDQSARAESP